MGRTEKTVGTAVLLLLSTIVFAQESALVGTSRIQSEIAAITSRIEISGGSSTAFVGSNVYVGFIPEHAWIMSLRVDDAPEYGGEFFLLSEIDGQLIGELIVGAGKEGVRRITGPRLKKFLGRTQLDYSAIQRLYRRYYERRPEKKKEE
jgi:hypothetical protein